MFKIQKLTEEVVLISIFLIFFIIMSLSSAYFLRINNLMNIMLNVTLQGITAIGMTMVIIAGGIDLSVGGVLALSVWISAMLMQAGHHWLFVILIALTVAAACGGVNAFAVAYLKIPPMIATLAMMNMTRGLLLVISKGNTLNGLPADFTFIGQGMFFGVIPIPAVILIALYLGANFFMQKTIPGRNIYAVGGNPEAARVAGIQNEHVISMTYILSAIFACIAGLIFIARMDSAPTVLGRELEMRAIMGAVIGGTSVTFGGKGKLLGTFLGVLIVGLITNALDLLGVSPYYQQFIQGLIILIAVALQALRALSQQK